MEIGIATRDELFDLLELYKQLHPSIDMFSDFPKTSANRIWNQIERDRVKYFIAKDEGKIIAACFIAIIPNLTYRGKSIGLIENVIVDEKYRRKGIGQRIMELALKHAKEKRCYKVILQSGMQRTDAHKFYEKLGFNDKITKGFEIRL